jgi:hypothetical protein
MRMMNGRTDSLLGKALRGSSKACKSPGSKKAEVSKSKVKTMFCLFYSPELSPCDFFFFCFVFPAMKNLLKGSQSETEKRFRRLQWPSQTACRRMTSGNASTVGDKTGIHIYLQEGTTSKETTAIKN